MWNLIKNWGECQTVLYDSSAIEVAEYPQYSIRTWPSQTYVRVQVAADLEFSLCTSAGDKFRNQSFPWNWNY